jgi:hypothetical protein
MPEDVNPDPVESQAGSNPDAPQADADGDDQQKQETFDREYVEKLRSENAGHRTKLREAEKRAKELETKLERAGLDDMGRLKAERDDYAKKVEALEAKVRETELKGQLAGQVTDPEVAMLVISQSDDYVTDDGKVNIEKLLVDKPYLKAQPDPKPGPAPTTAGGSARTAADMNALIRQKAGR